jgi:hypothetical protein
MPVTFGNPALLLGMLAAALPVLIHFLSRRRVRRIAFSDLRFLRDAQTRQARSLGIRRWLLLLLRVLAILCVALAMARPQWGGLAPGPAGARAVLFILDASASMGTQGRDGTRLDEATRECSRMLASLPDDCSVQVLVAGATVRPLFAAWLPAGTLGGDALAPVAPDAGAFGLATTLRAAARQVATAPATPVEIVLIGDLQETPPSPELAEAVRLLRAAGETRVLVRRVGVPADNGGVLAVELPRRAVRPGETVLVSARVLAGTTDPVFRLELDGQRVAETVATAEPGEETSVRFSLTVPPVGRHRGWVRKVTDRFPADDARPFVLDVRDRVAVRLVHGADRDAVGRGGWRYLAAALRPEPDAEDAVVDLTTGTVTGLAAGDLGDVDVVVFVDPDPLGRQLLSGLVSWIRGGGAAVFLIGDPTAAGYLEQTLLPALGFPATVRFVARPPEGGERTEVVAREHPLLAGLGPEALATLAEVTWWRTFAVEEGDARVLLALTGGAPVLLERQLGAGRVVLLPAHLRGDATDLAFSPMSLPLWQRLVTYLAWSRAEAAGARDVGEPSTLALLRERGVHRRDLDDIGPVEVIDPAGGRSPARLAWRGDVPRLVGEPTEQAGFHVFLAGDDTLGVVAAAVPAAESRSRLRPAEDVADSLAARGLARVRALDDTSVAGLAAALRGRELGPWLLALAVAVLLLELHLGRGAERVDIRS